MTIEEKGKLIGSIIAHLKFATESINKKLSGKDNLEQHKTFSEGDTFLSLCFKSDKELKSIAKMTCG